MKKKITTSKQKIAVLSLVKCLMFKQYKKFRDYSDVNGICLNIHEACEILNFRKIHISNRLTFFGLPTIESVTGIRNSYYFDTNKEGYKKRLNLLNKAIKKLQK
jgi:hypothetical protein